MLYLKLYEDFTPKQIITYKGDVGQVISSNDDEVTIKVFNSNKVITVDKDDVKKQVKCLSQCDKRVVGDGDDRYLKCFYCGKEQRFR